MSGLFKTPKINTVVQKTEETVLPPVVDNKTESQTIENEKKKKGFLSTLLSGNKTKQSGLSSIIETRDSLGGGL